MSAGYSLPAIDEMDQEHKDLFRSVAAKLSLHDTLDVCNTNVSFDDGWSIVKGRFKFMCNFVRGTTSILPGKA